MTKAYPIMRSSCSRSSSIRMGLRQTGVGA